ncbi:hypothetical protein BCV69DRAFT_301166 [Microstroma glucosiphilum]|uniref:Uncharacterized protein n=1 Tax=Pseudomicrostroma glucosiphilum TaxID=1684307 RepID=A0A316U2I7_9BASI|nr:hypothetical protein BCV69DRAFT_301166 [Pseudomicrostroma glucosiphilum]PWN18691.1 hypothetical protein BCV69DRAFT_301166 [Pseudomicrostroma glucosiphilum]
MAASAPSPEPSSSSSSSSLSAGPASLGQMSSLSPECTPLKHRYDQCFNRWFEHYLQVTTPGSSLSSTSGSQATTADGQNAAASARKRSFWSRGGGSNTASNEEEGGRGAAVVAGAAAGPEEMERRRKLRDDLETQCGGLFGEYKGCVKKALQEKDILPLLTTARELNPFPFPDASQETSRGQQGDNEPFPFPQASKEQVRDWEKRSGW